jgi:hypothetical protein
VVAALSNPDLAVSAISVARVRCLGDVDVFLVVGAGHPVLWLIWVGWYEQIALLSLSPNYIC